jgi:hypothetical protein
MALKRGRPAKAGERYPSGDLKRVRDERHHAVLPRMRELYRVARDYGAVSALALDPRMSPDYAPGQLYLLGQVSQGQLDDGAMIARIYGRFERLHGRRRASASPDYQVGRRGREEAPDDDAAAIEQDFAMLRDCLVAQGAGAMAAVEQFWVEGRHINARELSHVLNVATTARRQYDKARKRTSRGGTMRPAAIGLKSRDQRPPAGSLLPSGRSSAAGSQTTDATRAHVTANAGEGEASTQRLPARHDKQVHDKQGWALLARTLFPHLAAERIDAAWDALVALRERERFRRDKTRREP